MATPLVRSDSRSDDVYFTQAPEDHFRALGVSSVVSYKLWCYRNGLSSDLDKMPDERQAEVDLHERTLVETRDSDADERHNPRRAEYMAQIFRGEHQDGKLSDVLHRIRTMYNNLDSDPEGQQALCRLVLHVEKYGDLMRPFPAYKRLGGLTTNTFLAGLEQLARHHADWVGPLEEWRPESPKGRDQFLSLVRHLLACYDVPKCFLASFLKGTSSQMQQQQGWLKHIGMGQNIRTAGVPMRITKRMAHMFTQDTGHHQTVIQALRRIQYDAFGGHWRCGWSLMNSPLGETLENDDFWETVVQFLANQPFLEGSYVTPIVDYIRNQKFSPQRIPQADGTEIEGPPPHPSFCMKGRSVNKLLQEVDQWHAELSGLEDIPLVTWEPSGYREFEHDAIDSEMKRNIRWSFHELTTSAQLQVEGRIMSHCVGSYVKRCVSGQESIWSLRALDLDAAEENQIQEHVMTVGVENKKKTITQYTGKYNLKPFGNKRVAKKRKTSNIYMHLLRQSPTFMRMWMDREGLSYG